MTEIGQNIYHLVCTGMVYLVFALCIDLLILRGRITRRLFELAGEGIQGLVYLPFRLLGTALRALGLGIWRGIGGGRRNRNQRRRVDHHHYYHGEPPEEAGGEDEDEDEER